MKIPLKNKKIALYLRRGVILTKDNLSKRNWHGSKTCVFCPQDKTTKHLFFQCNFARSIWSVIQVVSGLYTPTSIANIFGNWLHGIDYKFLILLRVEAMALIWSLWLCRNNKVFNHKNYSLLQVIYRCTRTLRLWSQLHRLEDRDLFTEVCTRLEDTARHLFSQHGWLHNLRIGPPPPYASYNFSLWYVIFLFYFLVLDTDLVVLRLCASYYAEAGCNTA
jgi:hypothetical protein